MNWWCVWLVCFCVLIGWLCGFCMDSVFVMISILCSDCWLCVVRIIWLMCGLSGRCVSLWLSGVSVLLLLIVLSLFSS